MFPRIVQEPRTGDETFHFDRKDQGVTVADFWKWAVSDLLSNATRGVLAEFIVARALGISLNAVRDEWGAYDLETSEGIKVEVKSAAFIQSWFQKKASTISFRVPMTRAWDAESNVQAKESKRQADVYVFALLAHIDQSTIDPLNLNQWHFYALPTSALNLRTRSQHSITLKSLETLSGGHVNFKELRAAVIEAAHKNQEDS
jgi:hypothetical protein